MRNLSCSATSVNVSPKLNVYQLVVFMLKSEVLKLKLLILYSGSFDIINAPVTVRSFRMLT